MPPSPQLYLLSGNGSQKSWWDDTLPHFRHRRPIPLELPGFGDNPSPDYHSLSSLSEALIAMTAPGQEIFAAGVNALVVLHALVRRPGHFSKVYLLAPVGAFLWQRRFARIMAWRPVHHSIHFLLGRFPKLFKRKFSSQKWTPAQYRRMGEGYRKCKAFPHYFRFVRPDNALDHFEWIRSPIEIIWGDKDPVLGIRQAAAWDSILPRAKLGITLIPGWEHYPYIDDPASFAAFMDQAKPGFRAHSKAGRLQLAQLAGLPVPKAITLTPKTDWQALQQSLDPQITYAVRSSGANEDQIDHSNAGLNHSFLRVPPQEVAAKAQEMIAGGMPEVALQEFVEPLVSGVAFVRNLTTEVELVAGHLEAFISGREAPIRARLSKMGPDWENIPKIPPEIRDSGFNWHGLQSFLQDCLRAFHYAHSDIEWAWDGRRFHLFQIRPVTAYHWRRSLTSANLDEILPPQVSRIMEYAQRRASAAISRTYARWDPRVLEDNEPFTTTWQDASYINNDLFLARFLDWGLPSRMYAREIGGSVPHLPFRPLRFLRNVPRFLRMQKIARGSLKKIPGKLEQYAQEMKTIQTRSYPTETEKQQALADWFVRYYTFIVQQNMLINAAISSAFGNWFRPPKTVYHALQAGEAPHRLKYESDPATPRTGEAPPLAPFPQWPGWTSFLNSLGAPGLRGFYIQVREWFRDNNMRLFHQLHFALHDSEWLLPHPGTREKSGSFWQSGGETLGQDFSFTIYPGTATGIAGTDILILDALEPGHYADYQKARAVVARTGGQLSHGATLLRELKKPSAVIPEAPKDWTGKKVKLENGNLTLLG